MDKKPSSNNKTKREDSKKISKDMTFQKILEINPDAGEILAKNGMGCLGCVMSSFETFEQGANAHGLDADKLIKEINA